jgi:anti-sigma regulatory factor (Ser/Thr protein kinase)
MTTAIDGAGPLCDRHYYVLPRHAQATNLARMWIRQFLLSQHREDLVDSGEVCISELVGNAITHTASALVVVGMAANGGRPLFEVWDDCGRLPEFPEKVSFDDLEAESGRGLRLVKHLSDACGTAALHPTGEGKVVWFRLPARPA